MFYDFNDNSVRLTGRWFKGAAATATAAGSKLEFAFKGKMAVMHFDMEYSYDPYPHIWISVDGGARVEAPLDTYLRINAQTDGEHVVTVIYKGAVEMQHRWHQPLIGKIAFKGYEADENGKLPENNKKIIEIVGDSITEGVLIDADHALSTRLEQYNRPIQDDVTATYGYLTAENLNLEPIMMGYGAVGVTTSGCGSVPVAYEAYPYCFEGAPIPDYSPDYILINHGANDRRNGSEKYIEGYEKLLDVVRKLHPDSRIIVLSAFCGVYPDELKFLVQKYNKEFNTDILFIDTKDWIPEEPLHPLRDGHKIIAENLTAILKRELKL